MSDDFQYDVFLSYSPEDKEAARELVERLRNDGLQVWSDEWMLKSGKIIWEQTEQGLELSRTLVLFMSANALSSGWPRLEASTFRFRDPSNKGRRFILLNLDDSPVESSLIQFPVISWFSADHEREYTKLLEACRPPEKRRVAKVKVAGKKFIERAIQLDYAVDIRAYTFSRDGKRAFTASGDEEKEGDHTVRLWDLEKGRCLRIFEGHTDSIWNVVWSDDQTRALSGSMDGTARLWDVNTGRCLAVLKGRGGGVYGVALSADKRRAFTGSEDGAIRIWDLETRKTSRALKGHEGIVPSIALSSDERYLISGSVDKTLRRWYLETGSCVGTYEGHTDSIVDLAWSADQKNILSASLDGTVRLWDAASSRCLRILEGHTELVTTVAWSPDQRYALSGSDDNTLRLWDIETGSCLLVLADHRADVSWKVLWSADGLSAFSGDTIGGIRVWDLSKVVTNAGASRSFAPKQIQYSNAKVLLVGESGVGKTGLSKRLAGKTWEPSDSTVGAWATQWKLSVASGQGVEREIWLWDFGGQADQRLIHQLYMNDTALAVLVFDGQKDDLFETLGQWDRDLKRAARKEFIKLLVAGRVDTGGLRVSQSEVLKFAQEHGYLRFLQTSAKTNEGCDELKQAIQEGIKWDEEPCWTTEVLFKRLREEIIKLKNEGRVLMRFNELRETLQFRLSGEYKHFADEELRKVLTLLAGPGVVLELSFGSLVLLQPERINAYAQAVISTLRADEFQRGCVMEERVLKGDLVYESSLPRLAGDEERFVLFAMHQTLVERGLCLRQPTARGNLLVFPSFYRRERPEQPGHPPMLVSYPFSGFLDEIYATLVVRLLYMDMFLQDNLWRYAADFKTQVGKPLGVKLTRRAAGVGELEVYFDPDISMSEKIIFSKYIHEHLLQHAQDVKRLRHYVCPCCGTPVGNREVAMERLETWLETRPAQEKATGLFNFSEGKKPPTIICVKCEKQRVALWDELEEQFASPEILQRVRGMQEEAKIFLDNQSKERALVGEVISTVALADQISREFNVSDQGLDMEIEFRDDIHQATGQRLYLQLKSGDSYLRERKADGAEIFTIKEERHVQYWMSQRYPVMLVIRNSEGEIRWMEVRDWLRFESDSGRKPVKQIVFEGERFDVMAVRRWREKVLSEAAKNR